MPPLPIEEKTKPFRLVKYFSYTSLIVIFVGILVLSFLNTHLARSVHLKYSEERARLLVKTLNQQIFFQFFIPVTYKSNEVRLRDKEQSELMRKVINSALHGFKIDNVTIFDKYENVVSFSLDRTVIGKRNIGGADYYKALSGIVSSKLIKRGSWLETILGFSKEIKSITSAPLRWEKGAVGQYGPMIGVIEIVEDLSAEYQDINRFQIISITAIALVMMSLLLVLILVVKRGEGIIRLRTLERIRLKGKLSRAQHLSSLGEMVASVSHEIRNPLGIILSSAELLKKKVITFDPGNTIPDIIVEEAGRLNDIITDFLNYARPRKPDFVTCQIETIIEKISVFLAPQLREGGYTIERSIPSGLPQIKVDPALLHQAFLNILINAMQAMPEGGKITITGAIQKNRLLISITDQGSGISEDLLSKIWDPFFTTKDKGTGLGLIVVKNIIEAHRGTITIVNLPRQGARVSVFLPLSD